MEKVAVVILNWNGKEYLKRFLPSVIENTPEEYEIWVADNASTDNSLIFVHDHFPTVKTVKNKINGGFAKGYNDALKKIKADYYILLNSDVEVPENWSTAGIELLKSDDKIAACQPKMLLFDNKSFLEHAGAAGGFLDKNGFPFCRGRIFNVAEKDRNQYDNVQEIFWATGACLFIKSDLFHQVDGFDEDFFAHMEEIDLCWRLKRLGYKIMYTPKSYVYHVGGGTLPIQSPYKLFLNFRNNLYLLTKNYTQGSLFIKLIYRMILDGIAGIKFLTEGKPKNTLAVLKAHFQFYRNIIKFLNKRSKLKNNSSNYNPTGTYKRSIVIDFFIKNKQRFTDLDQKDFITSKE